VLLFSKIATFLPSLTLEGFPMQSLQSSHDKPAAMKHKKNTSIDKAITVLTCFLPYNKEMGTVEISQKFGLHKATASRILQTLAKHGLLNQNMETKKFMLGPLISQLSHAMNRSLKTDLVLIAKPFIDALRAELKETVTLEVLSGKSIYMAYIAEGPQLLALAGNVGERVPSHAAAGAKAIVAFSPLDMRRELLGPGQERFTKNTITDPETFGNEVDKIRREGIAFDLEEVNEGTCAIGAPVFNHDGRPMAAVVVAAPSQRIARRSDSPMCKALRETAKKISACLHYPEVLHEKELGIHQG
jgi:IclR family transcriptional regulator, KDG regulon repressor